MTISCNSCRWSLRCTQQRIKKVEKNQFIGLVIFSLFFCFSCLVDCKKNFPFSITHPHRMLSYYNMHCTTVCHVLSFLLEIFFSCSLGNRKHVVLCVVPDEKLFPCPVSPTHRGGETMCRLESSMRSWAPHPLLLLWSLCTNSSWHSCAADTFTKT